MLQQFVAMARCDYPEQDQIPLSTARRASRRQAGALSCIVERTDDRPCTPRCQGYNVTPMAGLVKPDASCDLRQDY